MNAMTINGIVSKIEKGGEWAAFVLSRSARVNFSTKILMKGEKASEALKKIHEGREVVASGEVVKIENGTLKLFADMLVEVDNGKDNQ